MKPLPPEDIAHVVKNVPWEKLNGKRILMTGATGFFGRWMVESFLASGCEAQITVAGRTNPYGSKINFFEHDFLCNFQPGYLDGEYDTIIWMANHKDYAFDLNVARLDEILTYIDHDRFLFTSSGAIYDVDPLNPNDAYGVSKVMGENLCVTRSEAPVIARCFSFAGPGISEDSALLQIIRGAMKGEIHLNSDGSAMRTYMYASDLAVKLWNLAIDGETFKAHDVGGYQVRNIRWLAETVAAHFTPQPRITYTEKLNTVRHWYVQPDICERDCAVGIDAAIEKTVRWYRET